MVVSKWQCIFVLSNTNKNTTMPTPKSYSAFMPLAKVAAWFTTQGLDVATLKATTQFISIEETGPMDLLHDGNIFISVSTISPLLTTQQLREMQCEVVTHLDEPRYYHQVKYL